MSSLCMFVKQSLYKNQNKKDIVKMYRIYIIINILLIFLSSNINLFIAGSSFAESNSVNSLWFLLREPEKTNNKTSVTSLQTKPTSIGSTQIQVQTKKVVQNYFSYAFKKNTYDVKVVELQKLLTSLNFFKGTQNGIYDSKSMESVYQYQLSKKLVTPKSPV